MSSDPAAAGEITEVLIFYTIYKPDITIGFCIPGYQFFQSVIFNISIQIPKYRLRACNPCADSSVRINPGEGEFYSGVCTAACTVISCMGECIIEIIYHIPDLLIGYQRRIFADYMNNNRHAIRWVLRKTGQAGSPTIYK